MIKSSYAKFILIWIGQFISNIGSGVTAFALGVFVFQRTGSAADYSLLLLAAFLPSLLLKPFGGALADRLDRRGLMILGDLGTALGIVFIVVMWAVGRQDLWVIYAGMMISSLFGAIHNPAYKASVTDLVEEMHYSKASGLIQLSEASKFLIAPAIACLLTKMMSIQSLLIMDALSFLLAIIPVVLLKNNLAQVKPSLERQSHFFAEMLSGFNYTYQHKDLMLLLLITSLITFFVGLLQALLGPMILAFADAKTLGFSQSIATIGMLVSGCFIGVLSQSTQQIKILSFSLSCAGICFALMGISPNITIITMFGFLFFLILPFINSSLDVLVRKNVPNQLQGRVWSIVSVISQLGMIIAFGVGGYLADRLFNPLLYSDGALASTLGTLIGTGAGRGIGLMFIIAGLSISIIGLRVHRVTRLNALDISPCSIPM